MPQNVNRVIITANLTRDPELKATGSGLQVCNMRVACNGRTKQGDQWVDSPNYFDVVVFGSQAENCKRYLAKGRGVAVDGRLDWREWTTEGGDKRQAVQIVAENIQFLSDGNSSGGSSSGGSSSSGAVPPPVSAAPDDDDLQF